MITYFISIQFMKFLQKGDIKPANFLYDRKKKIFKLVDFGLAQRTGEVNLEGKEPIGKPNKNVFFRPPGTQ